MRRFMQNRCLAYILALNLLLGLAMAMSTPAAAVMVHHATWSAGSVGGTDLGDPDGSGGTGKSSGSGDGSIVPHTRLQSTSKTTSGDGGFSSSDWMLRLRILLQEIRARFDR